MRITRSQSTPRFWRPGVVPKKQSATYTARSWLRQNYLPKQMPKVEQRLIHLDMLRGLAAIGVVVGHIRSLVVVDYAAATTTSALDQGFYYLTGLGHQCV